MKKAIVIGLILIALLIPLSARAQQSVFPEMGQVFKRTFSIQTTDASQLLTTAINTALGETIDFNLVRSVLITCEGADARISFGVAAENDASPVGHVLSSGGSLRPPSQSFLKKAYIISKTAGSAATLMITMEIY